MPRLAAAFVLVAAPCFSAPIPPERALLARGEYEKAITQLESVLAKEPTRSDAAQALLECFLAVGRYKDAVDRGTAFLARQQDARVAARLADALNRIGEYERAAAVVENLKTAEGLWWRGSLARLKGDQRAAQAAFSQAAAMLGRPGSQEVSDRIAIAESLAALTKFQEANSAFRDASHADPDNGVIKVHWGMLMLEKHNPGDAEGLFREALEVNKRDPMALIGMARLAAGNFDSKARTFLKQALDVNPNLADAHLLLARTALEEDKYQDAEAELAAVDRVNARHLESWSLHAVSKYLQGQTAEAEKQIIPRILAADPAYGEVYADLADFLVLKRRYVPAVEFYKRALQLNPQLADARSNLGINLLRLGNENEARQALEEAYRQDPFNAWTVNTLRLMDSFVNFDQFEDPKFRIKLQKKESALLRPYVEALANEALASLSQRYGYTPPQKVLLELYPDHEDFAVRTLGMPGLGALGASFGPVVAMDSPSARKTGEFHWGSTLWHELTHVITLGMTDNRVPRWFTEGLSVFEETRAKPGWGDPFDLGIVQALQKDGLIPIADLDAAFVRPKYPQQVAFAYFQAGLICEFIADRYGFTKILAMLKAYADQKSDEAAIREALNLSLSEFDEAFADYARKKTYDFGKDVGVSITLSQDMPEVSGQVIQMESNDTFLSHLRRANELRKEKKNDEAAAEARRAQKIFPLYVQQGNPYELLADIEAEKGNKEAAAAELMEWVRQKGRNPETFKKLADLLYELGRRKEAIETLQSALNVAVFDVEIHQKIGAWQMEEGNPAGALREYGAVLALDAPDKAEAHYQMANAYWKLSDAQNARREVLAALEIAPGYRPAQKLLLEMSNQ